MLHSGLVPSHPVPMFCFTSTSYDEIKYAACQNKLISVPMLCFISTPTIESRSRFPYFFTVVVYLYVLLCCLSCSFFVIPVVAIIRSSPSCIRNMVVSVVCSIETITNNTPGPYQYSLLPPPPLQPPSPPSRSSSFLMVTVDAVFLP